MIYILLLLVKVLFNKVLIARMFKLDDELIKDRFTATSFSFYTDSEIEKLSVKQILNPTAFDHLGNPTSGGIYDKTLGVSPFDHRSQ